MADSVPLDRHQLAETVRPSFFNLTIMLAEQSTHLVRIADDIEDLRRSRGQTTISNGPQLVYGGNPATNTSQTDMDPIQNRVQLCIEDLSAIKWAQEYELKPAIESANKAVKEIKAISEETNQKINDTSGTVENIHDGLGFGFHGNNTFNEIHDIAIETSQLVEEVKKVVEESSNTGCAIHELSSTLVSGIQHCKSSIACLKESFEATNIETANREARFRNSYIRSGRNRITALSIAVIPSDESKPKEAVVPPHEILPRTVRRYWLALKHAPDRDVRLALLHEFYSTPNWQNWGLDDLDESAEPHVSLEDATSAAPDIALELLSTRLGLDWDFLRKHMEYMDSMRPQEVVKAQQAPITDPVHGLTVSRKRSRAELIMDEGDSPRCAGVRAVRLCPPKKRAIIERFSGFSAALEGGATTEATATKSNASAATPGRPVAATASHPSGVLVEMERNVAIPARRSGRDVKKTQKARS